MQNLIVTTCGTSLLTNGASPELSFLLRNSANKGKNELSPEERDRIDHTAADKREILFNGAGVDLRDVSAELNGLLGIIRGSEKRTFEGFHFLVHTDTYQGELVAEMLREWCTREGIQSQAVRIDSLSTKNLSSFREGIGNLMNWCQDTLPGYRTSGYRVTFNLVGGFKSLQGYMQTLGMLFADESVYVFEGERELLRIPRLPLDIDSSCRKTMEENLLLFRRLSFASEGVRSTECAGLPEMFLFCMDGMCTFSEWGKILWEKFRSSAYRDKLLDSPSDKIRFGKKLRKEADSLDGESMARINGKIDDLARFLETGFNPKSLSFKILQGKPVPGCTHEFYLWSDKDAGRGFGFFDGPVFVFEDFGSHL